MNKCEKCIHKPICNWVERNCEKFSFPEEDNNECEMFREKEQMTVGEIIESKNNAFDHTIEMMRSPDYKERFKAEYYQLKTRHEKLNKFNTRIAASFETRFSPNPIEEPKHDCPYKLLIKQQEIMEDYLHVLEIRAEIEGIDL